MLSHFLSPPTQPNSFPGTMLDWLRSKNQQHLDWIPIGKLMITKIQISSSWLILMYVWSQSLSRWSLARLHTKGSIMFGLQAFLQQQHTSFMRIFLGSHQSIGAALRATCISQKHLPITTRLEISHKNSENKAWKMNSGMVWDASWEFSKWEMSLCFCIFSLMRCWYEEPRRRNKVTVSTWNSEASLKSQLAGCQASRGRPAAATMSMPIAIIMSSWFLAPSEKWTLLKLQRLLFTHQQGSPNSCPRTTSRKLLVSKNVSQAARH